MSWEEYKKKNKIEIGKDIKQIAPVKDVINNLGGNGQFQKIDNRSWREKILQKPQVFDDGYQVGDVLKTIGGTTADLGMGFAKGIANVGEGLGDTVTYGAAQVHEWLGNDERANQLRRNASRDIINEAFAKPQSVVNKASILGDTGDKAAEGMGYMASIWASSTVGGELGGILGKGGKTAKTAEQLEKATKIGSKVGEVGIVFQNSLGSNMSNIYKEYDPEEVKSGQAWLKSAGGAAIEAISEELFGMFGNLDTKFINGMSARAATSLGKVLTRAGLSAAGEGIEEIFSYAGNYVWDRIVDAASRGEGAKFAKEWNWDEMWEEAGIAALTALASGGGSTAIQTIGNKTNTNTWRDAINMTAEQQNKAAQAETVQNDIETLQKQLPKTSNPTEVQEIQNELAWKQKQLQALSAQQNEDIAPVKQEVKEEVKQTEDYKAKLTEEIQNSKLSESDKAEFLDFVKDENITEETYNDLKNNLNEVEKATVEANKLNTDEKYNTGRKEKYAQYMKDNSDYDTTDFDSIMEFVRPNNQGRRTKEQWLSIADELGKRISNKSNEEIEKIAYKTWQDTRPNAKENLNRQGKGYVQFNSDEWIDAIYNAVNQARENNQTQQTTSVRETKTKDTTQVKQEVQDYLKKNNINMTTDEFMDWASNKQLEQEENMTPQQKELYSLISDIQNRTNMQENTKVEKNSKKVYNIINKSITNQERKQVDSEVKRWRLNQEDGLGYIDLSKNGYKSYIYNKKGNNAEVLLKINGSEDFKNYIRKGVEDGTFTNAKGFNKSIAEIKSEYRKYRISDDSMSGRNINYRNDKLSNRQIRGEENNNATRDIKQNSRNESIKNSKKSSFSLSKDSLGRTLTKEQQEYFKNSMVRDENGNLLVVYHGTNGSFNIYRINRFGKTDDGMYGKGFYFTDKYDAAKYYGNKVKKQFLNITNPLYIGKGTKYESASDFVRDMRGEKFDRATVWEQVKNGTYKTVNSDEINDMAKKYGYDGIIVKPLSRCRKRVYSFWQ